MGDLIWSSFIGNGNQKIVNYLEYIFEAFMESMRGQSIAFVGDFVSRNQFQS
jgi:hypothetical protein